MELVTRATSGRPVERKPRTEEIPATYPKGRICSARSCKTVLSQYNGGRRCNACHPTSRFRFLNSAGELMELMQG